MACDCEHRLHAPHEVDDDDDGELTGGKDTRMQSCSRPADKDGSHMHTRIMRELSHLGRRTEICSSVWTRHALVKWK